ncbi:MAG: TolC family protein [Sedimentisphaerales bacterium]|nr:TolC family protein [Sedimentisphaerales bacterium]
MDRYDFKLLVIVCSGILLFDGCRSFDGEKARKDDAAAFEESLAARTAESLGSESVLELDDCIRIALENNLSVKSSEIQTRIAKLERKISFSNFLPVVDLNIQYTRFDPQQMRKFGAMEVAMSDRKIQEITWQTNISIWNPLTWLMYSMHVRGEEIAKIVHEYTREMTVLHVTVLYFHCLSLEEVKSAIESQLAYASALDKEMQAFRQEGLIADWEAEGAGLAVLTREAELRRVERAIEQVRADLLAAMGLGPLSRIRLAVNTPLEAPDESLERLITEALLHHPELRISDRQVAIEDRKVELSIAIFLPTLTGFAGNINSSDSFLKYSDYWVTGLAGTLRVFDGFANVNRYKLVREQRKDAYIKREQTSLSVMLRVVKAYLNMSNAAEEAALAERYYAVSSKRFTEVEERWREGLVSSSEMLKATAERDGAQMEAMAARFQHQVSIATLINAVGRSETAVEGQVNED